MKQAFIKNLTTVLASLLTISFAQASVITNNSHADGTSGSTPLVAPWMANFTTVNDVLIGLSTGNGGISNVTQGGGGFSSFGQQGPNAGIGDINDGAVPGFTNVSGSFGMFASVGSTDGGLTMTFNLASPTQLTEIQYIGGWGDSGRDELSFSVSYSTDNGLSFTPYDTVLYNPSTTGLQSSNFSDITDSSGTIGNGAVITNLQFTFNATENGYGGLEEIAAYGVPEPSTIALGLSGALVLGLCLFRRRLV